jgi:C1A family cysteine protease
MYLYSLTGTYVNSVSTSTLISLILNRGVIAIAVSVNNAFYQYSSGILTQMLCPNGGVNHAVAAVGYGTDSNGKYYFIIKNSWGPSWGQFGYVYIYTDACNMRYYAAYLD